MKTALIIDSTPAFAVSRRTINTRSHTVLKTTRITNMEAPVIASIADVENAALTESERKICLYELSIGFVTLVTDNVLFFVEECDLV